MRLLGILLGCSYEHKHSLIGQMRSKVTYNDEACLSRKKQQSLSFVISVGCAAVCLAHLNEVE